MVSVISSRIVHPGGETIQHEKQGYDSSRLSLVGEYVTIITLSPRQGTGSVRVRAQMESKQPWGYKYADGV